MKAMIAAIGPGGMLAVWALPGQAACKSAQAPRTHYVINGNEVCDRKHDLTWMRCSEGQRWDEGAGCEGDPKPFNHYDATEDRSDGWRLPTLEELKTLVSEGCEDPAIDGTVFPDTPSEWFHTSTKIGGYCWYVVFYDGGTNRDFSCNSGRYIRLVRNGK